MPTVKTQNGNVITKDGKVSCECCLINCSINTSGFPILSQAQPTLSKYTALYAGGTFTMAAVGNITSTGSGGDFPVTTNLTASGTCGNSYIIGSPTCKSLLGEGSQTPSVSAQGSYQDDSDPPMAYISDGATGTISTRMFGYSLYNSGGTLPLGVVLSASATFSAAYSVDLDGIVFQTDRSLLLRTQTSGSSTITLVVDGSSLNFPAAFSNESLNNDPGTGSLSLTITFTSSAP